MKKLEQYKEIHSFIEFKKDQFTGHYTLDIVDKNDNIILSDKNKFASGPAAQRYFEKHYLAKHNTAKKPKIKIESVQVFAETDDNPDTSLMGEYTAKAHPWAIDRRKNEYVYKTEQRERLIEALQERLQLFFDDKNEFGLLDRQKRTEKRIEKLEQSAPEDSFIDRNSYEYFKPFAGGEKDGTANYRKYGFQDYKRMEGLNNCDWHYIGIIAKAKILIPSNVPTSAQYQTISSGGIWGIESDGGKEYLQEEAESQLADLAQQLEALGLGKRAIQYAIKKWNKEIVYK